MFRTTCVIIWRKSALSTQATGIVPAETYSSVVDSSTSASSLKSDTNNQPSSINNSAPVELDTMTNIGTVRPENIAKLTPELREMISESLKAELLGLVKHGTFRAVPLTSVPGNIRDLGYLFVDELNRADIFVLFKSQLVAKIHADEGCTSVATNAPTVQRFSKRLVFMLAAYFFRYIIHAYTQSDTYLEREVNNRAPGELGQNPNMD